MKCNKVQLKCKFFLSATSAADGKCLKPANPVNGTATCQSTPTTMQCSISCPTGFKFEYPPAAEYVCRDGTWSPRPTFPKCIAGKNKITHLSGVQQNSYIKC